MDIMLQGLSDETRNMSELNFTGGSGKLQTSDKDEPNGRFILWRNDAKVHSLRPC
jgi:hypothetical protein